MSASMQRNAIEHDSLKASGAALKVLDPIQVPAMAALLNLTNPYKCSSISKTANKA
jgi:hypothetical protein